MTVKLARSRHIIKKSVETHDLIQPAEIPAGFFMPKVTQRGKYIGNRGTDKSRRPPTAEADITKRFALLCLSCCSPFTCMPCVKSVQSSISCSKVSYRRSDSTGFVKCAFIPA